LCNALSEFEWQVLDQVPDAFSGHTDEMFSEISRLRVQLRVYTDFLWAAYNLDKKFGDVE